MTFPGVRSSFRQCALTKDRARTGHSQKIVPGLEASNQVRDGKPGPERSEGAPSQKIGRELGAHKRSHPDLKHLTKLEMSSPDLSEVRVQRITLAACVSANPNVVRVRPHKRSDAKLKRITLAASVSANPNYVRGRGQSSPSFSASFGTHLNATWYEIIGRRRYSGSDACVLWQPMKIHKCEGHGKVDCAPVKSI